MCGFSGIYAIDHQQSISAPVLKKMTDTIRHRGPDDEGYLLIDTHSHENTHHYGPESSLAVKQMLTALPTYTKANLGFGFRRLSILDLSESGHQPMSLAADDLHIVFNGEIYNYQELRTELKAQGCQFNSASDTEVILMAYRTWGQNCVQRFIGMWSFAIWDGKKRTLFCSRDRYGIKPFYYLYQDGVLYFASEIKQLNTLLNNQNLNNTMIWRSVKINAMLAYENETFWEDIISLQPGYNLTVSNGELAVEQYYQLDQTKFESYTGDFDSAVHEYRELFLDSIRLQMRSDVEVGSCLSGGMDSSAIVCAARNHAFKPLQTFSAYYGYDPALDERKWIQSIVDQTGSNSHLISPTAQDAIEWFDQVTYFNDLPTGAGYASQFAVMKCAKEHGVKVLLDGQGSDEITAGYGHSNYRYYADQLRKLQLGRFASEIRHSLRAQKTGAAAPMLAKIALSALMPESKLYDLEFRHYRFDPFNRDFVESCKDQPISGIKDINSSRLSNFLYNMMNVTSIQTLLHYEDRMSMANSVESRVPFLDHRLVEFAFSLPSQYKIKPPTNKYIHRMAMKDIVPDAIFKRTDKAIFSSPFYSTWMRGEFTALIEHTFNSKAFRERGIWNISLIQQKWKSYLAGNNKDSEMLFNVMALETWFNQFVSR